MRCYYSARANLLPECVIMVKEKRLLELLDDCGFLQDERTQRKNRVDVLLYLVFSIEKDLAKKLFSNTGRDD